MMLTTSRITKFERSLMREAAQQQKAKRLAALESTRQKQLLDAIACLTSNGLGDSEAAEALRKALNQ